MTSLIDIHQMSTYVASNLLYNALYIYIYIALGYFNAIGLLWYRQEWRT